MILDGDAKLSDLLCACLKRDSAKLLCFGDFKTPFLTNRVRNSFVLLNTRDFTLSDLFNCFGFNRLSVVDDAAVLIGSIQQHPHVGVHRRRQSIGASRRELQVGKDCSNYSPGCSVSSYGLKKMEKLVLACSTRIVG